MDPNKRTRRARMIKEKNKNREELILRLVRIRSREPDRMVLNKLVKKVRKARGRLQIRKVLS
jgi:hypothetical protein